VRYFIILPVEINLLSMPALYFWNCMYHLILDDEDQVDSFKANGIEACFIQQQSNKR
jgi:hypothetical protein